MDNLKVPIILHQGDTTDYPSVISIFYKAKPDYIFHLAAQSFVPLSWQAPVLTLNTNIMGTLNILDAVKGTCPRAKVLIAGSSEEYGYVKPKECPITENQPLRPMSPYGVSKVAADLLAQQYAKSYALNVIITRAFNHTGPRRGEVFVTSKIAKGYAALKLKLPGVDLRLGNLDAIRDWTDVRDMVRAYWLAINQCTPGEPYNIGTGRGYSIDEVTRLMAQISEVPVALCQDPSLQRPSDVPLLICDSSKFSKRTGWQPEIPFTQTLTDLYKYWLEVLSAGIRSSTK
jgi:GDP-4-dehydro-6-deoxy-D-mannose reductase